MCSIVSFIYRLYAALNVTFVSPNAKIEHLANIDKKEIYCMEIRNKYFCTLTFQTILKPASTFKAPDISCLKICFEVKILLRSGMKYGVCWHKEVKYFVGTSLLCPESRPSHQTGHSCSCQRGQFNILYLKEAIVGDD